MIFWHYEKYYEDEQKYSEDVISKTVNRTHRTVDFPYDIANYRCDHWVRWVISSFRALLRIPEKNKAIYVSRVVVQISFLHERPVGAQDEIPRH